MDLQGMGLRGMDLKGDASRYGPLAALLHWASAAAVLAGLALGFLAARSPDPARTADLLRVHAPIGLLVLALTVVRLAWRRFDRRPAALAGPRWQTAAARATHGLLYGLLLLMGTSGIALMAASGAGAILFGGAPGPLPDFSRFGAMAGHAAGALALAGLLALHVGAALHHRFRRGDGVFARMSVRPAGR